MQYTCIYLAKSGTSQIHTMKSNSLEVKYFASVLYLTFPYIYNIYNEINSYKTKRYKMIHRYDFIEQNNIWEPLTHTIS